MSKSLKKTKSKRVKIRYAKTNRRYVNISKYINEFSKKGKIQRKVANTYRNKQRELDKVEVAKSKTENLQKTLKLMTEEGNKFSTDKFWKLRKSFQIKQQNCTSVISTNGKDVYGEE